MRIFYQVLSYLLLPAGVFMGFIALFGLLLAFANLSVLLTVFLAASTCIYIFASFSFLNQSLLGHKQSKRKLFDWIRINGIITGSFGMLLAIQGIVFFLNPEMEKMLLDQMKTMPMSPAADSTIVKTLRLLLGLFVALGLCLFVHVMLTLRLLRQNRHMFR